MGCGNLQLVLLGGVNTYLPALLATGYVQLCGKIQIKLLVKEPKSSLLVSPQPLWMRWEEKSLALDGTQTQLSRSIIETTVLSPIYITCHIFGKG